MTFGNFPENSSQNIRMKESNFLESKHDFCLRKKNVNKVFFSFFILFRYFFLFLLLLIFTMNRKSNTNAIQSNNHNNNAKTNVIINSSSLNSSMPKVDGYQLNHLIGKGSYGHVFRAEKKV